MILVAVDQAERESKFRIKKLRKWVNVTRSETEENSKQGDCCWSGKTEAGRYLVK